MKDEADTIEDKIKREICQDILKLIVPKELETEVSEKIGAIKNFWNISQRTNLFM